jgi:hypothetical protein
MKKLQDKLNKIHQGILDFNVVCDERVDEILAQDLKNLDYKTKLEFLGETAEILCNSIEAK